MAAFSFGFYTRYGFEDSSGYHDRFLSDIGKWLMSKGLETIREKTVMYRHRDRKSGAICSIRGLIDLYAWNAYYKVAVEFDNGKRLKFKSIEKLNNSDADILVGVVVGSPGNRSVRNNNQRYGELANNNPSVNKDIWLIFLSESRIDLLSKKEKTPLYFRSLESTKADGGMRAELSIGEKGHRQRTFEDY